ncbi:MAG: ribonuclease III [Candidatus Beckwithbacteria bacterium]|nr:ribonuclease III [Patescibacteria group bacterium]
MKTIANYTFKNQNLLTTALTHRSALNEKNDYKESYERLEFLGDAVLELVVSSYLFKTYPKIKEGELTHLRSNIVQTKTLAATSKKLKLGSLLIFSSGETKANGNQNISILADCFESIVGAIYIDKGYKYAEKFIKNHLLTNLKNILKNIQITDYKSQLQELWQLKLKIAPIYKLIKTSGPDHQKTFTVNVLLKNKIMGKGAGMSKQEAQQIAAKDALEKNKII